MTIELTEEQWQRIYSDFPVMLSEVVTFTSEDAAGVVYRLGLILFTCKEATEIGTKLKLSARTVDDVLKSATGVSLTRIKAGHYQRV